MATNIRPAPVRSPRPASSEQHTEQIAARVRQHLERRTLSHPHADLDIAALARRVRALSEQLRAVLIERLGEHPGRDVHQALFLGGLDGGETLALWSILKHAGVSALAAETLCLKRLSDRARCELDELIARRARIEAVSTRSRLIRELLDAEEHGDAAACRDLASELALHCAEEPAAIRSHLARARRDRIRLAQLTTKPDGHAPEGERRLRRWLWHARLLKVRNR
jgi:hypothetical protein